MQALTAGERAPDFSLPRFTGPESGPSGGRFTLFEELKRGPVVLAFFKISCPTCQFAFPYFDRIFRALAGERRATVAGISQNSPSDTSLFISEFDMRMPVLLDDPGSHEVSNAYGISNVPTLFLISPEGNIELSSVGWARADVEELAAKLEGSLDITLPEIFHPEEQVPPFVSGCASLN